MIFYFLDQAGQLRQQIARNRLELQARWVAILSDQQIN